MPINIQVQSGGSALAGGLAGAAFGYAGAEEGRDRRRQMDMDEQALQARLAQIRQQIAESEAAMQAQQEEQQRSGMLNQALLEGAQWINPPADAEEQVIRENFDESLLKDARLKNVPDEQAEPVRRTARAAFQRFYGQLSPESKAVLMRSKPEELQRVLGFLVQREQEAQDQAMLQEAQVRAQEMQAQGVPVDISGAQSGQEAMAALDQAQDQFETAQAFEAQKQETVQFYAQKITPKQPAEGENASGLDLTRTEQLERKKALIRLSASRTPEELQENALKLEILLEPDGAVARAAQLEQVVAAMQQENEMLRGILSRGEGWMHSAGMVAAESQTDNVAAAEPMPTGAHRVDTNAPQDVQSHASAIAEILARTPGKDAQNKAVSEYVKANGIEVTPELIEAVKALAAPKPQQGAQSYQFPPGVIGRGK